MRDAANVPHGLATDPLLPGDPMVTNNVTDSEETAKKPAYASGLKVPVEIIKAAESVADELDALLGLPPSTDRDPKSREFPPPQSAFAVRLNDGAIFLSLEDAEGLNLAGRKIVAFMQLTDDEILLARTFFVDKLDEAAALLIGALPK